MSTRDIAVPGPIMAGKRGLIMGVANNRSIAWGIARVMAGQGAKMAFTYQGDAFGRRGIPLAESLNAEIIEPCDVKDLASMDAMIGPGTAISLVLIVRFFLRSSVAVHGAPRTQRGMQTSGPIACRRYWKNWLGNRCRMTATAATRSG